MFFRCLIDTQDTGLIPAVVDQMILILTMFSVHRCHLLILKLLSVTMKSNLKLV
jgi:hypothetical protein